MEEVLSTTEQEEEVSETLSISSKVMMPSQEEAQSLHSCKDPTCTVNDISILGTKNKEQAVPAMSNHPETMDTESTPPESDVVEAFSSRRFSDTPSRRRSSSTSRRSSMRMSVIDPPFGLSRFTLSCIVINYVSAGYLLLPHAFAKAGTLLSSIVFALVALQSFITASFVLNTCARAEALANVTTLSSGERVLPGRGGGRRYSMAIRTRKYELSKLTRIFLGKWATIFFMVALMGDLYGITWLFAAVFGSTLSGFMSFGSGDTDYKIYVLAFMIVTTSLTLVPILDQLLVQLTFLGARLLMVALMLATVAVGYVSDVPQFGTQVGAADDVPLADFGNLILIIQTAIFSTAFQFAVPMTASIGRDKKAIQPIFKTGVSFIYFSNLIMALVLSVYFGKDNTEESSNLNWESYHSAEPNRPGWAVFLRGYIVLFAAFDSLAVFPLIAVSLSDILMDFFYPKNSDTIQLDWKKRTCFRLLASMPQVLGAMFVKELDILAIYGGIFTLLSYTICPSVLLIQSRRRMIQEDLPVWTHYNTLFTSDVWAWILIVVGVAVIVGIVLDQTLF